MDKENNKRELKMFHVAFSFSEPKPGVITLPAEDEDHARKLLLEMAAQMKDVVIHDVASVEDVPTVMDMVNRQAEAEQAEAEEQNEQVEKDTIN